ncbi:MAG: hypothetical protein HY675_03200 [Chloroflexi bacterium]|nr:hypothetical protein [Chloroflexota bacterium]
MGEAAKNLIELRGDGKLPPVKVILGLGLRPLLQILWALVSNKRRSPFEDAKRAISLLSPAPIVEGHHHVPRRAPFVLVGNHYEAPGLWIGWVAAAITVALGEAREPGQREIRWVVHPEWGWFEAFGRWVPNPVTSLIFPRAIQVWGMIPMPARPSDVSGRARALRQILSHLRPRSNSAALEPEPIGLFPEGTATSTLREAKPGSGALLHRINRLGVPLLPVGTYLDGNVLIVRFGPPFHVVESTAGPGEDTDSYVRRQVMTAIGQLLPEQLWGPYAAAIRERNGDSQCNYSESCSAVGQVAHHEDTKSTKTVLKSTLCP